ncbi:MAG: ABC transporter ATP-binding protein [Deltaproteobacteria bacterium]|nr:ABC transporter ATP-binding protein [Deltaproteobacteria bacterium]
MTMKYGTASFLDTFRSFLPLKPYFIQNRWSLALGLLSLLLVDFAILLIPLVIKRAIDLLTVNAATPSLLFHQGLVILGLAAGVAFFRYVWRYHIFGHSRKVEEGLRNQFYEHLQKLPPSFYHRTRTGDLMAKAVNDINGVRMATGMGMVALTDGVVLGLTAIGFMLSINVKLTLISLIPAPIIILLSRSLTRRMSKGFETVQETFSHLTERVREAFSGIRIIKAYNRQDWALERIRRQGETYIAENLRLAKVLALFFPMMTAFTNAGLVIVIGLGGRLAVLGDITTGEFVAFISYLNLLTWPMMGLGWVTSMIQRGAASMRRINGVLKETPDIADAPHPIRPATVRGEIQISGLSFRYPGKNDHALKDVHLRVLPGETVALVGRVGSGKTTLTHVIPRLLDPPPGTVFLDGNDIRRLPLDTLRKNIGFVTQEPFVFSGTIRDNILFGRKGVSEETLEQALRKASFLDDVQKTPSGTETILGERGITLSGGQRQRLTIARALISDPPVLIMDDALSMVDTRTEEKILNGILGRRNKTSLIISHRIPTIRRADRIVVIDNGRIVEQGRHETLLSQGGVYAELYERQRLARELET